MNDLSNSQTFKEFKWFNSHSIPVEIQCGICRLELAVDVTPQNQLFPKDIYITAQIISNQIPFHECPMFTHFAVADNHRNSLVWDCVLSFPVKLRDLSLNSVLTITAWSAKGVPVGGTTMKFFDMNGSLKQGKQKLIFFLGRQADPNVIADKNRTPGELYEYYKDYDYAFQMEKHMEKYRKSISEFDTQLQMGRSDLVDRVEWLDRLTLSRLQGNLEALNDRETLPASTNSKGKKEQVIMRGNSNDSDYKPAVKESSWGRPAEELDLETFCCLVIELPIFPYTVLHEERLYPSVQTHNPPTQLVDIATNCVSEIDKDGSLEFAILGRPFQPSSLCVVADWDMDQDNLAEDQYRSIAHDIIRGAADPSIKPNLQEKERIDRIVAAPGAHLTNDEMDLLYKFRYTLTENRKALVKFLLSIKWNVDTEVAELPQLLAQWKEKAPIDVSDALKLLGRERAFEHPYVRGYAVEILQTASNEELLIYLLQLVQALRYEPTSDKPPESPKPAPQAQPVTTMFSSARLLGGNKSITPTTAATIAVSSSSSSSSGNYIPPLASFLINRACKSVSLANSFYWYLKVETQDKACGWMFEAVMDAFILQLSNNSGPTGSLLAKQIMTLDEYIMLIAKCQQEAKGASGDRDVKQAAIRRLLAERNMNTLPPGEGVQSVPFPLNPSVHINGLLPETVRMFKSAVYPCYVEFTVIEPSTTTDGSLLPPPPPITETGDSQDKENSDLEIVKKQVKTIPLFLKSGDDLRQDQLIMQLMLLMDDLLKKVNLDLKVLTYRVLAITQTDGIMEFVAGSYAVSAILSEYKTIQAFFKHFHPDKSGPYEISAIVMDTFVKSCAASCVITYLLGIGDRHLDNIMICPNGQLFHIDFGFIFGQDPKPLPPPFRFTREMADAMGGVDSEHYARFKAYCCQAYNWLRKSANLILNLLSLMGDAGIEDISMKSDLAKVLLKVEEKFRLDLTDEQAEQFFLGLINESLTAIAPRIMEIMHKIAVARR